MMGRTHVHMALVAGMATMALVGVAGATAMGLVRVSDVALWCALAGGSGKVPDIDHARSSITRALGPLTWLLHCLVVWLDRVIYGATRTGLDPPTFTWGRVRWIGLPFPIWSSSHRRSTHTYPGAVLLGILFAALCLAHPLVAVLLVGGLILLGEDYVLAIPVMLAYFFASIAVGLEIREIGEVVQSLGPIWGIAIAVACVSHCWGDSCTKGGAPLWFPLTVGGQRWDKVGPPVRIGTDGIAEKTLVKPVLVVMIVYLGWVLLRQWVY